MNVAGDYLPILIFLSLGFGLSFFLILLSFLRGPRAPYAAKLSPYECGFDVFDNPEINARRPIDVRFYLVGILFIIFDLEVAFLFPWAVNVSSIGSFGFLSMMFFLMVLTIGFIYEWKKGALDWH